VRGKAGGGFVILGLGFDPALVILVLFLFLKRVKDIYNYYYKRS